MELVREFSPCGPCITKGRLTKKTNKFFFFNEWRGGDRFEEGERRISRSKAHIEPCPSCRDHKHTQYPNGYED